ncbi:MULTISPECIES: hypothetical protein [Streptomyces]|uniref:Uncharacterized protein n=1 Tax=Streptomyces rimosus subsp. rimosus TaxID=132474 RepID=A0ABY3Z5L7_STRRM|nr:MULTISPECIES: hypothetical protein [Streptomyces]KEF04730.1 hypothetical protein DF17_22865 [Streptomyces rimosus]KEF19867.1 hypothetical protein DF18_13510 [Streptomyces rimosus]UNZ05033.1 hypothetical protein SRIMR7_23035 [Streptomyces rimosus subsp. rimosus]UTH96487.1 hypothetical protein SRIMHP_20400 [Streptomyces rimosus subsp. rimosus]UTJ14584.1 hypothetical protein SRIMDV3_20295 [Streptomyces rimosus subsp. rimosus]
MIRPDTTTPPGPGFVAGVRLATGLHHAPTHSVAQLLVSHVPPRLTHESDEHIRSGMESLAVSLRLGPVTEHPPMIGHRVRVRRGLPWLDYGDDSYRLCVPAAPSWVRMVATGTPVRILVMFEPLSAGADQNDMDAHVRSGYLRGSMRWGSTYHV